MPSPSNDKRNPAKLNDDKVSQFILNPTPGSSPEEQREHLHLAKSRGLISRYGQKTVVIREFESDRSGPFPCVEIKKRFKSGELTEKTLVYVEEIQGWLSLPEVFDLRKWRTRTITLSHIDEETGQKVVENRLEPEPIRTLLTEALSYPAL